MAVLHDTPIDAFAMLREMLADLHEGGQLMDSSTVVWTAARLLTQLGMHREALLLDDALGAVGVRTLAVHDPALDALSPDPFRFDDDERRRIRGEAAELVAGEPGSLRPLTEWLLSIEP